MFGICLVWHTCMILIQNIFQEAFVTKTSSLAMFERRVEQVVWVGPDDVVMNSSLADMMDAKQRTHWHTWEMIGGSAGCEFTL